MPGALHLYNTQNITDARWPCFGYLFAPEWIVNKLYNLARDYGYGF